MSQLWISFSFEMFKPFILIICLLGVVLANDGIPEVGQELLYSQEVNIPSVLFRESYKSIDYYNPSVRITYVEVTDLSNGISGDLGRTTSYDYHTNNGIKRGVIVHLRSFLSLGVVARVNIYGHRYSFILR